MKSELSQSRIKILEMVKNKKISVEEGFNLIRKLEKIPSGSHEPDSNEASEKPTTDKVLRNPEKVFGDQTNVPAPIAIIGMSGRFPGANNTREFWENLKAGVESIQEVPKERWDIDQFYNEDPAAPGKIYCRKGGFLSDIDRFDAKFFNITPREAELMDPQQRLFLQESWKAFEDAGYSPRDLNKKKCGVFVGCGAGDYHTNLKENGVPIEGYTFTGNAICMPAAKISYYLNLRGPNITLETACSSSLVAVQLAVESIQNGSCEMAIAGGVTVLTTPELLVLESKSGMLSPDGKCKAFDNDANGFVSGEGVGVVVLKLLDKALQDGDNVYAVIRGGGINYDGKTNGITAPSSPSQTALECEVYDRYKIHPETITYVETHGTGTKLGDPIEVQALTDAFSRYTSQRQYCAIGSVKTNVGHGLIAAGIISLIKTILCIKNRKLVPSLNFNKENEHIHFSESPFYVNTVLKDWEKTGNAPRRAAISSFGFSGTNSHLVIEEAPAVARPRVVSLPYYLIVLAAKTQVALEQKISDFANWLEDEADHSSINDIAYTLFKGRDHYAFRTALVVKNKAELREKIKTALEKGSTEGYIKSSPKGTSTNEASSSLSNALNLFGKQMLEELVNGNFQDDLNYREKLLALADLYVAGYAIDFSSLYNEKQFSRISLPGYPFAKERYWIPTTHKKSRKEFGVLHPLLDSIDARLSLKNGIVFSKQIKITDPVIQHHKVQQSPMFPGMGYLEMAHSALSQVEQHPVSHISQVYWLSPLIAGNSQQQLRISVVEKNDTLEYEIITGEDESAVVHSKGAYHRNGTTPEKNQTHISVDEIKQRCPRKTSREEIYTHFAELGMHYGPYYQGMAEVWSNDEEALGKFELPLEYHGEVADYTLHPALMDTAIQTAGAFIANLNDEDRQTVVPYSIDEVEILQPLPPRGYAYVMLRGTGQFHVTVLDESGIVCVKLHNVTLRKLKEGPGFRNFFYKPVWQNIPAAAPGNPANRKGDIIIVHGEQSLHVEKAIGDAHPEQPVHYIKLGTQNALHSSTHREIKINDPLAWENLFESYSTIGTIYFLGGIEVEPVEVNDLQALEQSQQRGVLSLFRMVKALTQSQFGQRPIELKVITNDVHQIIDEDIVKPFAGSLFGLCKSMAKEYPQWDIACVDISLQDCDSNISKSDLQSLIKPVLSEPANKRGDEVVIRHGRRYIRNVIPVDLAPVEQVPFRKNGVYLILGGAGGIGSEMARYLSETVQANLILIGRSPLDRAKQETIDRIESKGGKVLYLQADANDLVSMQNAVEKAKAVFGNIHGAIHSAIVLKDKSLKNMDEASFREAADTKIQGSVILHRVLQEEPLDFMLFFSAGQSFGGNAGQSNYVAGCTFKDAFATYLNRNTSYEVKIINWGYWGTVGIVATEEYYKRLTAQGLQSISPEEGMEAIKRVMGNQVNQVLALKADEKLLQMMGIDLSHQIKIYPADKPSALKSIESSVLNNVQREWGEKMNRYESMGVELDRLCESALLNVFKTMGVFHNADEKYHKDDLRKQLGIIPDYFRLFESLLDILENGQFIALQGEEVRTTNAINDPVVNRQLQDLDQTIARFLADAETQHLVKLLKACIDSFPEILTGKIKATSVMFPGSSMDLVGNIYKNNIRADYFNNLVTDVVVEYIRERIEMLPDKEKINILEVGAGTGGTSVYVFDKIKAYGSKLRYVYTDISKAFTQYGEKTYGTHNPFIEFQVFDLEKEVARQGFALNDFDLVIASNVIHATKNLRKTLRNIKPLMKKNGLLVLNESTRIEHFATLTFGLLEGWWLYDDVDLRLKGGPLLSVNFWNRLLKEEGFPEVASIGFPHRKIGTSEQHVIIAESNGSAIVDISVKPGSGRSGAKNKEAISTPVSRHFAGNDLQEKTCQYIKSVLADVLKINREDISDQASFEEFGVDSLVVMNINKEFENDFGKLSTTLLFENTCVEQLAQYFIKSHIDTLKRLFDSQPVASDVKSLFNENTTPVHASETGIVEHQTSTKNSIEVQKNLSAGQLNINDGLDKMVNSLSDVEVDELLNEILSLTNEK